MKKIILILVSLMFVIFCVSCDDTSTEGETPDDGSESEEYTVIFFDENGDELKENKYSKGEVPSYSYVKQDTAEWDYTFLGWSKTEGGEVLSSVPEAREDASYYAVITKVKQTYTVSFNTGEGSAVISQTVEYGGKATQPDAPKFDNHKFMGWSLDSEGESFVDFSEKITGNVEYFAIWNRVLNVKELLSALLGGYNLNPYTYIPEEMRCDYNANLVNTSDLVTDYSSAVSTSDISTGFGEQWNMIIENLNQSQTFFNLLSTVEGVTTASVTVFNDYFDSNPSDTAHHTFKNGIYNVTIDFDGEYLYYVLDYTAAIPLMGEQTVQIAMYMIAETGEKAVRIQIGDANALTYKIRENSYEFAIKYLGVRRAYFSVSRDELGNVEGHIYEHLTVSAVDVSSAADFYITDEYVSAVGNKANGMIGFTGYISELYSAGTGKMIGYEVKKTISNIEYNTLWFNLKDISGINSIRYQAATDSDEAKFFVNGKSVAWGNKKVGGVGTKMFSRRFDIEFRTQYVYSYDSVEETYVAHKIQVPMIFVQEENYSTFQSDVREVNGITVSVLVSNRDFNKLLSDYRTMVPIFMENKELITSEIIIAYIGEKIVFNEES